MEDWSKQFDMLLSSPLGKELIRTLREDLSGSILEDARKAKSQERGWGLLNQSAGVIKAIEHLQFLSVVSTGEGGKVKIKKTPSLPS